MVEEGFFFENLPHISVQKLFNGFHWSSSNNSKIREYYENILIQTGSTTFKHYPDRSNPNQIAHSTIQILKILRPIDWPDNPNSFQKFPVLFTSKYNHEVTYNYWDYKDAWYKVFLYQNTNRSHSWFIFFKTTQVFALPAWIHHWWDYFGPTPKILSPIILRAFDIFKRRFKPNNDQKYTQAHIIFFTKFYIPWIQTWEYHYVQEQFHWLVRKFKSKWWNQIPEDKIGPEQVIDWFNQHPQQDNQMEDLSKFQENSRFLQARSQANTLLAQAKTKQEYKTVMKQILSSVASDDEEESTNQSDTHSLSSISLGNENEDDCFGILPPVKHNNQKRTK